VIRAVLGGSFDPVHAGHVAMAAETLSRGLADRIVVIPNGQSPHKRTTAAGPEARLAMVRLAFAGDPRIEIDESELGQGRPVPTVETLRALARRHPEDALRLILGADHVEAFPRWQQPDAVQELAELVVFGRRGWPLDAAALAAAGLRADRVHTVPDFDRPVSSREVRAMLAAGTATAALLPPAVAAYVAAHGLYGAA